jgi:quercetin dioxygenase-like cupin family protein
MIKIIPSNIHSDKRGQIIDLIENENINAVTFLTFQKNAIRGNHYHEKTFQWNYVISGKIKIVTELPGKESVEIIMEKGDLIVTLPGEKHALMGLEDSELMVFTKGPRGGKEYESDTFRLDVPLI